MTDREFLTRWFELLMRLRLRGAIDDNEAQGLLADCVRAVRGTGKPD